MQRFTLLISNLKHAYRLYKAGIAIRDIEESKRNIDHYIDGCVHFLSHIPEFALVFENMKLRTQAKDSRAKDLALVPSELRMKIREMRGLDRLYLSSEYRRSADKPRFPKSTLHSENEDPFRKK